MALIKSTAIPSGATDYELEQSLKFDDIRETSLKFVPSSSGNRKIWTFSCWVKRGLFNAQIRIFGCYQANDSPLSLKWDANNKLTVDNWHAAMVETTEVFRDTSAWYHIISVSYTHLTLPTN